MLLPDASAPVVVKIWSPKECLKLASGDPSERVAIAEVLSELHRVSSAACEGKHLCQRPGGATYKSLILQKLSHLFL